MSNLNIYDDSIQLPRASQAIRLVAPNLLPIKNNSLNLSITISKDIRVTKWHLASLPDKADMRWFVMRNRDGFSQFEERQSSM